MIPKSNEKIIFSCDLYHSQGEEKIGKLLKENNINFIQE